MSDKSIEKHIYNEQENKGKSDKTDQKLRQNSPKIA